MEYKIHKVLVIGNRYKTDTQTLISEISEYFKSKGVQVQVLYNDFQKTQEIKDADVVFSLGGDGTVLYCSRILSSPGIPIIAVNLGDFGFITEVSKDEWKEAYEKFRAGLLGISERIVIDVEVYREGARIAAYKGLNDAVVSSAGISKLVRLHVALSHTKIGVYRADGIIVATPTGSTAYSVAAGGPILDPEMEALIINPICPFTLSNRPIVAKGNAVIQVEVSEKQRTDVILTVDGQNVVHLQPLDQIIIKKAAAKVSLVRSDKRNFFEVLRTKLNWSGGPDA